MVDGKRICSKCVKVIKDDHKFCPSCGGKVVDKEDHRVHEVKKRKLWLYFVIPIVLILVIASIVIFAVPFPYKAVELYNVQEPYTDTEPYRSNENSKGCDDDPACSCTHKSWLGLGACDSCSCTRTRTVTRYRTVEKERDVWNKDTLFNIWTGKVQVRYRV